MKSKRMIILISIAVLLVTIIVLSSTVFCLRKIDLTFYDKDDVQITDMTKLEHYSTDDFDDIIANGEFKKGSSIFLINKSKYMDKLESNNPYLKVISLQIKFPNRIVIKAVERQEMYYVVSGEEYVVLDTELKVLRKTELEPDLIKIVGLPENSAYALGSFISGQESLADLYNDLVVSYVNLNKAINMFSYVKIVDEQMSEASVKSIELMTAYGEEDNKSDGVVIKIQNISNNLEDKVFKAISIYNYLLNNPSSGNVTSGVIKVLDNITGYYNDAIVTIG